jgi:hypothetical protein
VSDVSYYSASSPGPIRSWCAYARAPPCGKPQGEGTKRQQTQQSINHQVASPLSSYYLTKGFLFDKADMICCQDSDLFAVRPLQGGETPSSSGCRMCDECGGIHRVISLFSLLKSWKASDLWLSWPSIISSTWLPTLRSFICSIECFNQARPISFVVQPFLLTPIRY